MREVKLHVAGVDDFFADARRAAGRIDAGDLRVQETVIAFENMETLLKVLTANRWRLLRTLRARGPMSIRQLSRLLARDYRGVHSDVTALIEAGLVEKTEDGSVAAPWSRITAEMSLDFAA
jgi:predicted transcriptional regulator